MAEMWHARSMSEGNGLQRITPRLYFITSRRSSRSGFAPIRQRVQPRDAKRPTLGGGFSQGFGSKSQDAIAVPVVVGYGIISRSRWFHTMYRYLWLGLAAVSLSGCFNKKLSRGKARYSLQNRN
jgi:hypothetical protein